MRVVVQRVSLRVDGMVTGEIATGLVALVGVGLRSTEQDAVWLADKAEALRIFPDEAGLMNRSVADVGGGILTVSQFTLYGDTRRGRRPSFVAAAPPERAERLYEVYCDALSVPVGRGVFGAHMEIELVADGPVTLILQRERGASPSTPG